MVERLRRKALIIGGGIGGLTVALALRQANVDVTVFESTREIKEVGAGITLWSNAVHSLQKLGLMDALQAIGMPAIYRTITSWRGELLSKIRVDQLANGMGAAIMVVHRADLQAILLQALGESFVQLGARCTGFREDEKAVYAQFEDGREVQGDLLIGADGVRSTIRGQLFSEKKLVYTGYTSWRGIAPLEDERITVGVSDETWGSGRRIGLIPLNSGRMYWFAVRNAPAGWAKQETGEQRKQSLQKLFRGWHEPVEAVIEATEAATIINADIYDLELLPRWSRGRVVLLGDAAHAMTPNMGQGGCQAIEDAVVLAACLQENSDIAATFQTYETRRLKRTRRVWMQSRRIGWLSQLENPLACQVRNALVKRFYTGALSKELDWVLSFQA